MYEIGCMHGHIYVACVCLCGMRIARALSAQNCCTCVCGAALNDDDGPENLEIEIVISLHHFSSGA